MTHVSSTVANRPPTSMLSRILLLSVFLVVSGCSAIPEVAPAEPQQKLLTVFLVRHAEKAGRSRDPSLSIQGEQRARALADTLRSSGLEFVHSSNYKRTRETAAPTANQFALELQLYDPRDMRSLAEKIRATGGTHLVVGHSNTTPHLVELLGGSPGDPIDEKSEYDRIYVLSIRSDKAGGDSAVTSVALRYGEGKSNEEG